MVYLGLTMGKPKYFAPFHEKLSAITVFRATKSRKTAAIQPETAKILRNFIN